MAYCSNLKMEPLLSSEISCFLQTAEGNSPDGNLKPHNHEIYLIKEVINCMRFEVVTAVNVKIWSCGM
jgi:hypothetical protein